METSWKRYGLLVVAAVTYTVAYMAAYALVDRLIGKRLKRAFDGPV